MTLTKYKRTGSANSGAGSRYWRGKTAYLGVIPFLLLTGIFLLYPTFDVIRGAFRNSDGEPSNKIIKDLLGSESARNGFKNSIELSAKTAVLGALLGSLFAWAVANGKEGGFFRKFTLAAGGVLAQFGGVMLTFAFLATFGFNGLISAWMSIHFPDSVLAQSSWLYGMNGLTVVYALFQIPLMFLVFLPTIDNLRPQWREASDALGGNTFEYWRRIGVPVLTPSFLGATLLLFANSFSAYATAASLITSGTFITPLQISAALSSEVGGANAATAKALSLFMIIVVIFVMGLYALLRRKVSKWERI